MKIIVYCQHTLGVGHFFRIIEICKALDRQDIFLVTGGPRVEVTLPGHIRQIKLPGLQMDKAFTRLEAGNGKRDIQAIQDERKELLFSLFEQEKPDIFLVELYPFGRKKFRFELDPVLQGIRSGRFGKCRVVCSVRDILVEKDNWDHYEKRVVQIVNSHFDAVLVHSDPALIRLEETFPNINSLTVPVVYTGFVCPELPRNSRRNMRNRLGIHDKQKLIIASAGGGKVGAELLEAVLEAYRRLPVSPPTRLCMFTGPFLNESEFQQLRRNMGSNAVVERFTNEFPAFLAAADLSISMAGYNTSMNVLAAQVPALLFPFDINREQRLRAERLAQMGKIRIINQSDLETERLIWIINDTLNTVFDRIHLPDLNGAINTAKYIQHLVV